jgi:hypothetical protein
MALLAALAVAWRGPEEVTEGDDGVLAGGTIGVVAFWYVYGAAGVVYTGLVTTGVGVTVTGAAGVE